MPAGTAFVLVDVIIQAMTQLWCRSSLRSALVLVWPPPWVDGVLMVLPLSAPQVVMAVDSIVALELRPKATLPTSAPARYTVEP